MSSYSIERNDLYFRNGKVQSRVIQSPWMIGEELYPGVEKHPKSKERGGFLADSMDPTEEKVRQAGGFRTPSLTSATEKAVESNGGFMGSSIPSHDANDLVKLAQSKLVSASSPKRSRMLHLSNDHPNSTQLQDRSGSFASEQCPALEDNEERSNEMSRDILWYEGDWITELSLTEEETLQAAESERQANEVALTQMAALRTYDWVGNTFERGSSITPPLQIQSSIHDDDEYKSAFRVFTSSESAWSDEGMQNDGSREDPFQTPPNKRSSPRTTFDPLLDRSFATESSVAEIATPRDRQSSPCAYRGRIEANLLFNSLQHEVSTNQEPLRRSNEPETECEYFSRLYETPQGEQDDDTPWGTPKMLGFDALMACFDATTDDIIQNVKIAVGSFINYTEVMFGGKSICQMSEHQ
ncbi:hypothetical protein EPUS_04954 [Endocarpon pusillum Z07020]|uniref:Uncharacterized protein n=1 Tax=Endocarpon pusillum (strain Z07020 / HMAS-L-300199) TaxID=1263415 RepID=U1GJM8_ENDPU|nr:uncharacterized protein EPUS_04954 [Endocarpon pusillum Z07020]ERF72036.1 hypothetical protein EPUS_04954 [Endocarpon pusillum Z07020]